MSMNQAKDVFFKYIKKKNLRNTSQREKVLETFLSSEKHITADDLYSAVKKKDPKIGYATVHRNLKLMYECGLADEIKVGNKKARYEQKAVHHDHLICLKCGKFIEVMDLRIEELQDRLAKANEFVSLRHKLEIYGFCKECKYFFYYVLIMSINTMKGGIMKTLFNSLISLIIIFSLSNGMAEVRKIQDNSFLIEEAYNQEDGVIQHIQTFHFMKDKTWDYSFTEEWPFFGQTSQLSITVPVSFINSPTNAAGVGDLLMNYRYQVILKEPVALASRLSLVLPTGSYKKGLGNGGFGFQINFPLSIDLSDRWVTHWNIGFTYIFQAKEPSGKMANTASVNFGASLIFCVSETFNLLVESVWNSTEFIKEEGGKDLANKIYLNPGMRFAVNFRNGLQIVPGISAPLGWGELNKLFYGLFAYLSFEHPLF